MSYYQQLLSRIAERRAAARSAAEECRRRDTPVGRSERRRRLAPTSAGLMNPVLPPEDVARAERRGEKERRTERTERSGRSDHAA